MDRHAYKYLVKTVHRQFFPIFAILETHQPVVGQKVVAQRKLLFLEKMFGSLLIAAPSIRGLLADRLRVVESMIVSGSAGHLSDDVLHHRRTLLTMLRALKSLTSFYLPAVFRVGWLVRCCTWSGREARSSGSVREVLEEVLILLVHILQDHDAKNEYVRTLSVTLLTWQPWNEQLPSCCYMEESCEALLSRMSHRCSSHRHITGFEGTFDLFMTLPPPSRKLKATRGVLKAELIRTFGSRMRSIINSSGALPYAAIVGTKQMHSEFVAKFPTEVIFPDILPVPFDSKVLERVLRRALLCLTNRGSINESVETWLRANVVSRSEENIISYKRAAEKLKTMSKSDTEKMPLVRAPTPRVLQPKPRAPSKQDRS